MWFLQPGISFEYVLMRIAVVLLIVFLILPFHEFAHAFVAYKLGDRTAKSMGRITLNPMAHFDPIGAVCIMLFNLGWAKPVPVDDSKFKNPRRDMAIVSLAGPIANFLAALLGGLIFNLLNALKVQNSLVYIFLMDYILINIGLALFNLLPFGPLDGHRILGALIPERFVARYYSYQRVFGYIIFFLIFMGFLSMPFAIMEDAICKFIIKVTSWPFKWV